MVLVFMAEGPLLDKGLVWAASCPLFTGDFDPDFDPSLIGH